MIKIDTTHDERVSQGDIIRDVEHVESVVEQNGIIEISKIRFPLAVVLTQDCDLQQDFTYRSVGGDRQDKRLISVLVAPLYNAQHVFAGNHLEDVGIKSTPINHKSTDGRTLRQNQRPRYHYLEFPHDADIVPSVIDFKHYFSVPVDYLLEKKKSGFVCKVSDLFREDVSHRFSSFLSRIGLPNPQEQTVTS